MDTQSWNGKKCCRSVNKQTRKHSVGAWTRYKALIKGTKELLSMSKKKLREISTSKNSWRINSSLNMHPDSTWSRVYRSCTREAITTFAKCISSFWHKHKSSVNTAKRYMNVWTNDFDASIRLTKRYLKSWYANKLQRMLRWRVWRTISGVCRSILRTD